LLGRASTAAHKQSRVGHSLPKLPGVTDETPSERRPPVWSAEAERLVGRHLLVGITVVDSGRDVVEQRQFHGRIEIADPSRGIAVRRQDTATLEWLPPDLRAFRAAPPGDYTLRCSGETVTDPDVMATWTVRRKS
jgi:hypothetical protein